MNSMFYHAATFNQDISKWNVSNVTNMSNMFMGAKEFNQNINNWMVIKSPNMTDMFLGPDEFPDEYKPNVESSINRRNFGEVRESNYPPAKDKTVSTKPRDQVLGSDDLANYLINPYLGGKSKRRKTHKRKYKSKKKNISRKRKQSKRKCKKTNKK